MVGPETKRRLRRISDEDLLVCRLPGGYVLAARAFTRSGEECVECSGYLYECYKRRTRSSFNEVASCGVCNQLMLKSDVSEHRESHDLDMDFPRLG